ncbi:MAG: hypothetical protein OHK0029_36710 [Armatimonadaceae bacterium]
MNTSDRIVWLLLGIGILCFGISDLYSMEEAKTTAKMPKGEYGVLMGLFIIGHAANDYFIGERD